MLAEGVVKNENYQSSNGPENCFGKKVHLKYEVCESNFIMSLQTLMFEKWIKVAHFFILNISHCQPFL